jgi:divinyl chlorophyllide a 8-vinyl-reductase
MLRARTDRVAASTQQVIAFSREKAGVGGKKSKDDIERDFAGAYKVVFGDVTVRSVIAMALLLRADALLSQSMESLRKTAFAERVDVVVSCLASRTGGIQACTAQHAHALRRH